MSAAEWTDREWADHCERAGIVPGLIMVSSLPPARLELRWMPLDEPDADGYTLRCDYDIVIPLFRLDIRGEIYDEEGELIGRKRELRRSIGGCLTTGSTVLDTVRGTIRTPFRDHCHIRQDSLRTGLPGFVVAHGWAMRINPATEVPSDGH